MVLAGVSNGEGFGIVMMEGAWQPVLAMLAMLAVLDRRLPRS
jgi:hypothetical protein